MMPRLVAGLLVVVSATLFASSARVTTQPAGQPPAAAAAAAVATEAESRVVCGTACHAFPEPAILPRYAWRDEIARMALIRDNRPEPRGPRGVAGRMMVLPPDMERVLRYYLANAPERLPAPTPWPKPSTTGFVKHTFSPDDALANPAVANVQFLDVDGDDRLEIVVSDMRYGMVLIGRPYERGGTLVPIAQLNNPSHVALADFNKDGIPDFFVADLGEYLPSDHLKGSVSWLKGLGAGKYETLSLDLGPRVADVELADFNGDGTLDVVVAAFGWRKVGNLSVLENHTTDYSQPAFVARVIDSRPGAIHAIPTDLNGDGRLDLVALFAQQFETVTAFINNGTREISFTPHQLYAAPHPNWGSSGIQLADMDGDKDLDVLLSHGDTFDDDIIKPYHGVLWLENRGRLQFVEHRLGDLPGASRAQAADLDGDGDMDVVAGAFMAGGNADDVDESTLAALIWFEQARPGEFVRHTLTKGFPRHATLDLADFDRDGDIDIAVGSFTVRPRRFDWVEVWENQRRSAPAR
jgi:hypothetical protein